MASTIITRTPSSAGNRKTMTFSAWIKKSSDSTGRVFSTSYSSENNQFWIKFGTDMSVVSRTGGSYTMTFDSSEKYRDVNGWYHLVIAIDTTQNSATDRLKVYINGSLINGTVGTTPSQNLDVEWNVAQPNDIGGKSDTNNEYFDGSMSHVHFCDGLALAPTVFGSTDSTTGEWQINASPSFTLGTNGFTILKDGNTITDQSSNSNNFSLDSGTLTKTEDNPSNVFATLNPLARSTNSHYANGNTTYDYANNYQKTTSSTLATNNKKIYAEFKRLRSGTIHLGIVGDTFISDGRTVNDTGASWSYDMRGHTGGIALQTASDTGSIYVDGSYSSTNVDFTTTTNDIVMIAFDPTTKKIWWGKNGTWSSSGNPATGANASYTYSGTATSDFCFAVASEGSSAGAISANFGNGYFGTTAVSSAGANASGIGIFEYDVPANFTALSTKGLNL